MNLDVGIVGGGPAGSTLALRLSRLGFSVVVIERNAFTRARGGECLHPDVGILVPSRFPALPIHRARIRWDGDVAVDRYYRQPQIGIARPAFDAFLLDCARRAGATILQPASAMEGDRHKDGWILRVDSRCVRVRFLVDASGRSSWLRTGRSRTSERTIALRSVIRSGPMPEESRLEALEGGWIWGAPVPGGSYALVALVDATARRDLVSLLADSILFRDFQLDSTVEVQDATTYSVKVACEDHLLRVGDASHSLDPLSSSGIRSALQSAAHAATAINTILRKPNRASIAQSFYNSAQQASVRQHAEWTRGFYLQSRFGEHPFWRSRRKGLLVAAPAKVSTSGTLALAAEVKVVDLPCIVGEFVDLRRGISHPLLPRAFAWIGGVEAESLIAPLAKGPLAREELLACWNGFPPQHRQAVLDSLVRSGILECKT